MTGRLGWLRMDLTPLRTAADFRGLLCIAGVAVITAVLPGLRSYRERRPQMGEL